MAHTSFAIPRLRLGLAVLLLLVLSACGTNPQPQNSTITVTVAGGGVGTVTSVPAGIDVTSGDAAGTLELADGTEVTLTAVAADGSTFVGWSGACSGTSTCEFEVDGDAAVTATFALAADTLTVALDGNGTGNVTSVPAGIDLDGGDASAAFVEGSEIVLTATPGPNSTFDGWDGACAGEGATCTFTFTESTTITATFTLEDRTLDVSIVTGGTAAGSVTSDPAGIDATSADSADFPFGTVVTLTATSTGGAFSGWVGGGCDDLKVPVCDVTMDAAKDVIATFNDVQFLDVRVASGGDDALEFLGDSVAGAGFDPPQWFEGWVWAIRSNLHLGWSVYHNLGEAAFRFPAVTVPAGAIVTNATLQVTSAGQEDTLPATGAMDLTIEGELSANPTGFVQPIVTETSFAITTRPRTEASVMWGITEAWAQNTVHQAPNAASILQEIVDQPTWTSGNAVILFLKGGSLEEQTYRRVYTFESAGDVTRHPTLLVEYVEMPPLPF